MSSAEFNREIIRLGNRDGLNGSQILDILELADFYLGFEPIEVYTAWKESFDAEP